MMRSALGWLSPAGARGRLSILIFHRVLPAPDPLFPDEWDAVRFDTLCRWLTKLFNVLPLDHAVRRLQAGALPSRAAAITFDDGYADNHDVALPILQRHGLPATFFIATGFWDGGRMWNDVVIEAIRRHRGDTLRLDDPLPGTFVTVTAADRRRLIDRLLPAIKHRPPADRLAAAQRVAAACRETHCSELMMRPAQLQALRHTGMHIGAPTVNHPILAGLSDNEARAEIHQSKSQLEGLLDEPVSVFAYPNGRPGTDYGAASVRLVQEAGFDLAVSTAWGAAQRGTDSYQLPRFTPGDRTVLRFGLRIAANLLR